MSTLRAHRWEIGAGLAAAGAAAALVALAWAAARGLAESRELALDGRLLRLAHRVEAELREAGPERAAPPLAAAWKESREWVDALALERPEGVWEAGVGVAGSIPSREPDRRVELSLGRAWGGGPPSGGGPWPGGGPRGGGWGGMRQPARRALGVWLAPGAVRPGPAERALVPAALVTGLALVGLSLAAGRGARRERVRELEAVDRRRLEALARAGAGLAHQLRNPLATVKGSCQLLLEESGEGPGAARLRRALGEVDRMDRLLAALLDYARPPAPEPAALELAPFLAEVTAGRERTAVTCPPGLVARIDPEHLREIVVNLLDNASAVSPPGELVEVTARRGAGGGAIELEVADRGPGPGAEPEAWFEPYATGRVDGTGLGLPIARSLAAANGGALELAARPGGGAVARLRLVAAEEAG